MAEYAIDFETLISSNLFIEKNEEKIDSYTFRNLADSYNTNLDETRALLISLCIKKILMGGDYNRLTSFKDSLLKEIQEGSNSKNSIIECINYFNEIDKL